MPPCVLVTEKEYQKGKQIFEAASDLDIRPASGDEEQLAATIRESRATAVIVGVEPYSGALYEALAETADNEGSTLIARFGVGFDGVNLQKAQAHNTIVTNTPGVLDQSVAEHALWLMGSLARHVVAGDAAMRNGQFPAHPGIELADKTLGIIGFGTIGQRLARMAHSGLGMQILANDLRPIDVLATHTNTTPDALQTATGVTDIEADPNKVIKNADIVSIHLPAIPSLRHFVDAERLSHFKSESFLINTARGMLIDEIALYNSLQTGNLAGAALDVYASEPYHPRDPQKDLRNLVNTVLTPHVGSGTFEANQRMAHACIANVRAFLAGNRAELTEVPLPM